MSQPNPPPSKSQWHVSAAIAAATAVATLILLLATESQVGLTWDEPDYMVAAESYSAWFGVLIRDPSTALSSKAIDRYGTVNHEHPPANKIWSGAVWALARREERAFGGFLLLNALVHDRAGDRAVDGL